jgi:hypothetical protein
MSKVTEFLLDDNGEVIEDSENVCGILNFFYNFNLERKNECRVRAIVALLAKLFDKEELTAEDTALVKDILGRELT